MKKLKSHFLLVIGAVITIGLASCAPSIKVKAHYDKDQDFSGLKTFDWLKPEPRQTNPMEKNPILARNVKKEIIANLQHKGLKVQGANPDFYIVFYGSTREKTEIQTWGSPYRTWGYRGWVRGWDYSYVTTDEYEEGTLVIDIIDAKSNRMVWRGSGSDRIEKAPSKKFEERVQAAVHKILSGFPPK